MSIDSIEKTRKIKEFWDNRAKKFGESCQATLGEISLRKLEINTMIKYIKKVRPDSVLDVGCGNGYSTLQYAKKFPSIDFLGVDYSMKMINYAKKNSLSNCSFDFANVLDNRSLPKEKFDLVITQRCLQNLPDYSSQCSAINNLLFLKNAKGMLLLMECSKNGVAQLNRFRKRIGRKSLDNIEPWHNNFFIDEKIISDFQAEVDYFSSSYMFLAKVIYHRLSKLSYFLPSIGKFGYDRLYIIK